MTISIFGTGVIDSEDARISLANTALLIPTGNTLQRPSAAVAGMIRFNNTSNVFEAYNGISWVTISPAYVGPFTLEYLVVAGGGGGGSPSTSTQGHGGGGAGGFRTGNIAVSPGTTFTATIGGGGAVNANGSVSIFDAITSAGGGFGSDARTTLGSDGGSGGGGSAGSAGASAGGSGNTPATSPPQGSNGGTAFSNGSNGYGGGGGGASAVGATATNGVGGVGGAGSNSLITGSNVTYAGGGGGGAATGTEGAGGAGGGGKGSGSTASVGGTTNRGGGGGGGGRGSGGAAGGSGILILAHANTSSNAIVTAGLTYTLNTTSRPGFIVYTFTAGTGNIYWS